LEPAWILGFCFGVALSSFTYKWFGVRGLIRESQAEFEKIIHRLSIS
jgi:hypothetical protein